MKKILLSVLGGVIALPIILNISVSAINDGIARNVEKELRAVDLPENVELLDSVSVAGKVSGNGNGMQYFGAILVSGDISEEELEKHYGAYIKDVEVEKQESEAALDHYDIHFDNFNARKLYEFILFEKIFNRFLFVHFSSFLRIVPIISHSQKQCQSRGKINIPKALIFNRFYYFSSSKSCLTQTIFSIKFRSV